MAAHMPDGAMAQNEHQDEEDEVVATYSVFFTPLQNSEAHIFQFPLRGNDRPYEMEDAKMFCTGGAQNASEQAHNSAASSVVQPNSRLTLSAQVDGFGSSSFRDAEETAYVGYGHESVPYYYSLASQPFKSRSDYLVGYVGEGGIHFTPVDTIHQFTPVVGSGGTQFPRTRRIDGEFCSAHGAPLVPGLAASDRVQRELSRQRSVMLNADAATEKELNVFAPQMVESKTMCRRLVAKTVESIAEIYSSPVSGSSIAKATNSLFPAEIALSGGIKGGEDAKNSSIIRRFQNRYAVADIVRQLVQRCQVVTLSMCQRVLGVSPVAGSEAKSSGASTEEIVGSLKNCAVYTHGVWIARIDEHFKGVTAALREVIMVEFHKSADGTVARAELNKLVTSVAQRRNIKEILSSLAILNEEETDPTKRRWRLRCTADRETEIAKADFEQKYATEVGAQRALWEKRIPQMHTHLPSIRYGRPVPALYFAMSELATGGGASRSPAAAPLGSSSPSADDPSLVAIRRYIRALFKEHGVINVNNAKEMVMTARATHYPAATREMLSAALQTTVQRFTTSTWVLIKLDEPQVDQYRPLILQAVVELESFETRPAHALVVEKLKEKGLQQLVVAGENGEEAIPQRIMSRVLSEVAVYRSGEALWHLKTGVITTDN